MNSGLGKRSRNHVQGDSSDDKNTYVKKPDTELFTGNPNTPTARWVVEKELAWEPASLKLTR